MTGFCLKQQARLLALALTLFVPPLALLLPSTVARAAGLTLPPPPDGLELAPPPTLPSSGAPGRPGASSSAAKRSPAAGPEVAVALDVVGRKVLSPVAGGLTGARVSLALRFDRAFDLPTNFWASLCRDELQQKTEASGKSIGILYESTGVSIGAGVPVGGQQLGAELSLGLATELPGGAVRISEAADDAPSYQVTGGLRGEAGFSLRLLETSDGGRLSLRLTLGYGSYQLAGVGDSSYSEKETYEEAGVGLAYKF